ncbi:MAG: hypothetical protein HFACDABA_02793 [Anaerolineales bacterium]|nr:hypothetical protein [Anaerolineales bacterium]
METERKARRGGDQLRGVEAESHHTKKGKSRAHTIPGRHSAPTDSQTLFENAPIGFFQSTPRGKFIAVNPALARMYGYASPQEMIASVKHIGRQLYAEPEQRAEFMRRMERDGFVEQLEMKRLRKDGTEFWISTSASTVKDETGKILYYEGFVTDITEHKYAEQALRESEEWFRRLADTTSIAIFIYQGEKFVYANRASETLSGYSKEELLHLNFWDLVRPDQQEYVRQRGLARQQGADAPDRLEFNILCKDGTERWVDFTAGLIDWRGQAAILGTAFNITKRKQAEQSLNHLSRAVDASGDIVFLTDRQGIITSINPQFTKLYGYRAEEVVGKVTPRILKSGKQIPETYQNLWATLLKGEMVRSEVINQTKDRRLIYIEETVSPFLDERGEAVGFLAIQRDISARKQAELALHEMEERYRAIVEHIPAITYVDVADGSGKSLYVSPQIERLLGVSVDEWLQGDLTVWEALLHPEDRQRAVTAYVGMGKSNRTYDMEYRVTARDGRLIWFRDHASLLFDKVGQPALIHGMMLDITERKQAEQALRESEERFRALTEATTEGIVFHDQGRVLDVNPALITMFGYEDVSEIIGRGLLEFVAPEFRDFVLEKIRSGAVEPYAAMGLRKDGSRFPVEAVARLYDYHGRVVRVASIRDITKQKQAEEDLRRSEEKYRGLFENVPDGIFRTTSDGRILDVNPAFASMLGFESRQELIQSTRAEDLYVDVADRAPVIQAMIERGEVRNVEVRLKRRDGAPRVFLENARAVRDDSGDILYFEGVLTDITERKRVTLMQESIYEIARAAIATRSLDELYAKIHAVLQTLLPTQFFYIALYDPEDDLLSFPYFQDAYDEAPPPSTPGRGLTEYVLRTREPLLATSAILARLIREGEVELIGSDSLEWMGVPLIVHEQAIGVMVVQSYDEACRFEAQDMEVLTYVSTQVASAIERKHAEESLRHSEAFARSIVETEPECVKIIEAGGILRYMNPAGLSMIEAESLDAVRGQSVYALVSTDHRPAFQDLTERVLRGEHGSLQFEIIGLQGTRRWLDTQAVPLYDETGRVDALLGITRDITERRQADALQDAVYRITKAAENTDSIRDLFPQIHNIIASVMPAENFFITLYDETRNLLEFPYFHDALDEPFLEKIEPGMGLTAYVLRTGESLLCTQAVHEDLERRGEVKLLGAPSKIWLGVPLLVEGRAIGVMVVQHYTDPNAYGVREQQILEFVSSQIATTIQRKQSEQALRESEERYRTIIEQATEGMIIYDTASRRVLESNPAYQRLLGYTAAEMNELTLYDVSSHDRANIDGLIERIRLEHQVWLGDRKHRRKDGSLVDVEVSSSMFNFRGQEALLVVVRDTTERRKAERELRESEERYRSLVSGMLDGVYRSTHDGQFVDVNPAMLRLFGYASREEMLRINIKQDLYFAPSERDSLFLDTGQEKVDVFRMKRKDNSEIWVEDHGRYVHDPAGNVIYHEGILRDVTERIRAEREITRLLQESQQRLRHVEALRSIDLAIGSSMDLRTTLNILLSYVKSLLAVDAADILLFNRVMQTFEFAAGNGFRTRVNETTFHSAGRALAARVALERRVVQVRVSDEAQASRELAALWKNEGFVAYTGVPLIAKGDLKGVLEIHHRSAFYPETHWMELLQNFSTQAAIAIENAQLFHELQTANFDLSLAYDATIAGWSRALELRENEPPGRSQRVTDLTLSLARAMGLRDADLIQVRRGALLHDIGKMAVPDSILRKTGPLSEEEWGIMRMHPIHARELLTPIAYLRLALDIPCHHHEKWDGSGYPSGLKGEDIPLAARVFAVADVYYASTSDRFHRKGISREQALEYIKSESGKHFDPDVVGAFLRLLSKGELAL